MAPFTDFVMTFQRALKALQMYASTHPRYLESLAALEEAYQHLLEGQGQVQVAARNDRLFVNGEMEDSDNLQVRALARDLEARAIHALVFYPGASTEELEVLLSVITMKPAALRALGGAKQRLEAQKVTRIRILATRLEEVSEGGEVNAALLESLAGLARTGAGRGESGRNPLPSLPLVAPGEGADGPAGGKGAGLSSSAPHASPAPSSGSNPTSTHVVGLLQAFLGSLVRGGHPADMSGLGAYLEEMGLDRQGVQPTTQGMITKAVSFLNAEQQLGVLMGSSALRPGPLRNLFGRLSTTLAAPSLANAYSKGALTPERVMATADQLKVVMPSPEAWATQVTEALRREGMSEGQLKNLVEILTWESRPVAERIKTLLEGQRIFEMPVEKVLAFLRELLEGGRNAEFLRLLRHFATGLLVPAVGRRLAVAQAFEQIADWVDIPGMPTAIMDELMETLSRTYGREKDPEVHQHFSRALEHLLWFLVDSGEPQKAYVNFTGLQDVVTELSLPAAWKEQATTELLQRLGTPERLDKVLSFLFHLDRSEAAARVHPFLAMLGASAANHLVERLSLETDRGRRGRILEALKACGPIAEAPLLESLKSSEWFVVRNALIVLAEVAGPERVADLEPFLDHGDARVRLAALRTLGRIGGRGAEAALLRVLPRPDAEAQLEVLFLLDELKARNAVPALLELLKATKGKTRPGLDGVREKTLEVLGHLGSPAAIPVLADLLMRHKGFFRDNREPLSIRIAALRALYSLGCVEGQEALAKAMATEPPGAEREALQNALTEALSCIQPALL